MRAYAALSPGVMPMPVVTRGRDDIGHLRRGEQVAAESRISCLAAAPSAAVHAGEPYFSSSASVLLLSMPTMPGSCGKCRASLASSLPRHAMS